MLSNIDATDFVSRTSVPIFRDPTGSRTSWNMMEPAARKHDTFVYSRAGIRTLFWDASARDLGQWAAEIRAAVEALGM